MELVVSRQGKFFRWPKLFGRCRFSGRLTLSSRFLRRRRQRVGLGLGLGLRLRLSKEANLPRAPRAPWVSMTPWRQSITFIITLQIQNTRREQQSREERNPIKAWTPCSARRVWFNERSGWAKYYRSAWCGRRVGHNATELTCSTAAGQSQPVAPHHHPAKRTIDQHHSASSSAWLSASWQCIFSAQALRLCLCGLKTSFLHAVIVCWRLQLLSASAKDFPIRILKYSACFELAEHGTCTSCMRTSFSLPFQPPTVRPSTPLFCHLDARPFPPLFCHATAHPDCLCQLTAWVLQLRLP